MAERECRYCGKLFVADPRVGLRQKACSFACQKLRKQEHNRLYRERHPECWENHYRDYVKPWRQRHPDYQRRWREKKRVEAKRKSSCEIQAERIRRAIEFIERFYFLVREIKAEMLLRALKKGDWMFPGP